MFEVDSFTLGTLFGILITSLVEHYLAKSREKESSLYQAKMIAGTELNEAFADALVSLSPHVIEEEDAYTILKSSFTNHTKAVMLFKNHLKNSEKNNFEKAWYEYYCQDGDKNTPFLEQYSSHIGSHDLYKENCFLAVKRINKILNYTNQNN